MPKPMLTHRARLQDEAIPRPRPRARIELHHLRRQNCGPKLGLEVRLKGRPRLRFRHKL